MDCGFTNAEGWFRYRAAAIIIEDNCVLMAKNDRDAYYYSVGGGVHLHESAEDAVRREVIEEAGVAYQVDRLAFVHENFFMGIGNDKDLPCHEVTLYFLMKSHGTQELQDNGYTQGVREHMCWLPIGKLNEYIAYPTFFKEKLCDMSDSVEHIVTREY
jgi:8-oxo-dGTP pyrophosphatase MutT (NUDIX family)